MLYIKGTDNNGNQMSNATITNNLRAFTDNYGNLINHLNTLGTRTGNNIEMELRNNENSNGYPLDVGEVPDHVRVENKKKKEGTERFYWRCTFYVIMLSLIFVIIGGLSVISEDADVALKLAWFYTGFFDTIHYTVNGFIIPNYILANNTLVSSHNGDSEFIEYDKEYYPNCYDSQLPIVIFALLAPIAIIIAMCFHVLIFRNIGKDYYNKKIFDSYCRRLREFFLALSVIAIVVAIIIFTVQCIPEIERNSLENYTTMDTGLILLVVGLITTSLGLFLRNLVKCATLDN